MRDPLYRCAADRLATRVSECSSTRANAAPPPDVKRAQWPSSIAEARPATTPHQRRQKRARRMPGRAR